MNIFITKELVLLYSSDKDFISKITFEEGKRYSIKEELGSQIVKAGYGIELIEGLPI